jgi:hypothetical protein
VGVKLAAELISSDVNLRKFISVQGYTYNNLGKIIKLQKNISSEVHNNIYFELRCYEVPIMYFDERLDVTEDDLVNEIYRDNIKGFGELEYVLSSYIQDFSILIPEWNCDNLI